MDHARGGDRVQVVVGVCKLADPDCPFLGQEGTIITLAHDVSKFKRRYNLKMALFPAGLEWRLK